jgi:hypothetical protein
MPKVLMIDPTPAGWAYGFPKQLPDEAVVHYGGEWDYGLKPDFDLAKWVVEQGYPEEHFQYYSMWVKDILDDDPYVTLGSDPQQ